MTGQARGFLAVLVLCATLALPHLARSQTLWSSFTPAISFTTAGDLHVSYATAAGIAARNGDLVHYWIRIKATPTFTTALGALLVEGLDPNIIYNPSGSVGGWMGSVTYPKGFAWPTGATYLVANIEPYNPLAIRIFGVKSGGLVNINAGHFTSGQEIQIRVHGTYRVSE